MLNVKMILIGLATVVGLGASAVAAGPALNNLSSAIHVKTTQNVELDDPNINDSFTSSATTTEANHKVADAIANYYGVSTEEIVAWHDKGYGYGEIVKAYALADASGESVSAILAMKSSGEGWGNIEKNLCGSAGNPNPSLGAIMSGHAVKGAGSTCAEHGKGKGKPANPGNSGKHGK